MLILAIIVIIILIFSTSSFYILWARNQTNLNMLIAWYFLCFTTGIIVDCIRVIIIFGFGGDYPELDMIGYIFKCLSIFVAFTLVSAVHFVMSDYFGHQQPHRALITYYLIAIAVIFSAGGLLWSFTTPRTESDFYIFQFHPVLYFATFLAYLPVAALIFFQNLYILRSISNKKVKFKLILFTILTIFLIGERGFSLGGYHLVESVLGIPIELSLLVDVLALTVISMLFLAIVMKFPDLMESLSTYFSIKTLYVLKNNGLLIYEYDFEERRFRDALSSEDTLVGGFIYAITETFKEVLKTNENIDSFSGGNRNILVHHGKYVIGGLIVTEDSPLLHRKLKEFIEKYEDQNRDALEHWTGEFSNLNRLDILELIFKTLRED